MGSQPELAGQTVVVIGGSSGIGLETAPVNIGSYVGRANPRDVARNAMQRWYFTPNYECVRMSEDDMATAVVRVPRTFEPKLGAAARLNLGDEELG